MIYKYNLIWQWYLLVMSVPLFVTVLVVLLLPESARFLGASGKYDKVNKILKKIGKENKTGLPKGNLSTLNLSHDFGDEKDTPKANFRELFKGVHLKTTLLLTVLWFTSGFSYYGMVLLVTTFGTRNGPDLKCTPLSLTDYTDLIWSGFAEVPGTIITFYALEKLGRKKTLVIESIVAGCCLVPFFFSLSNNVYLACLIIGRATAQGIISTLLIYTPEVYPTFLRGKGIGVANLFFRTGGMLTPFFSQVTVHHYFNVTIAVYVGSYLVAAISAILLPKETQGVELED